MRETNMREWWNIFEQSEITLCNKYWRAFPLVCSWS